MKVGIITFHFVNNFGGALQAFALQKTIANKCNVCCEVIDYRNWFIRFTDSIRLFPITTNVKEFISGIRTLGKRFKRIQRFKNFIRENYKLSSFYGSRIKMYFMPPQYDKYICGSDQIWNPILTMGVSPCYFLHFVKENKNKIAYAPSFGTEGISAVYKNKIKKYLLPFEYLSVREKTGENLIKELTGRDAVQLIDPTFLLEKEEWIKLGGEKRYDKEKYILLYIMQRDESVYEYAKKLKKELGIKVIEISRYGYQPGFVDVSLIDVGPKDFLALFRDAAYICTNSYHGLIFSIIFEKEFCLIPAKRFQARINNLLELLHIYASGEKETLNSLTASYNREYVWQVIEDERVKAISYLQNCIFGNEEAKGQ